MNYSQIVFIVLTYIVVGILQILYFMSKPMLNIWSLVPFILLHLGGALVTITLFRSNDYNNKKQEYTDFGSTLNDALNGRKYRYDIIMSSESKEKNDNKNEYIF